MWPAACDAMARTGVLHLADRSIHALSGGERQRVVLARALAQDTPVLLLDEPGAFLDNPARKSRSTTCCATCSATGKSIVTVLHDLNLAALYCERVALLHRGRVFRLGTPAEVITYAALTEVYETRSTSISTTSRGGQRPAAQPDLP